MNIGIKIRESRGYGKNGKRYVYIHPDYYCFNKARKASGFYDDELQKGINNILRKWYQPELFIYEIDSHIIISNTEQHALIEYWRVCERKDIGKMFTVTLKSNNQ